MNKEYIDILIKSTKEKQAILCDLYDLSLLQAEIIQDENVDWDKFTENVDQKDVLVDKINELDKGFEALYQRVKEEIVSNKESYRNEITELKDLIKNITEKSVDIQTLEMRNKQMIEKKFSETRKMIKQSKVGTQAAAEYYRKVNKLNTVDPQLMDKKS